MIRIVQLTSAATLALAATLLAVPATAQESGAEDLSDPEVAHVAVTANTIDVELARLAKERSENPRVEGFAESMIADHTAVNERARKLVQRLGVTPKENAVSRSLNEGAEQARDRLDALEGEAFDRAYIEREVQYHQAVIDALDNLLIPSTENAELRQLLEQVRPALVAHLEHAKQVQKSLGAAR
jgi:putative membrane protein